MAGGDCSKMVVDCDWEGRLGLLGQSRRFGFDASEFGQEISSLLYLLHTTIILALSKQHERETDMESIGVSEES